MSTATELVLKDDVLRMLLEDRRSEHTRQSYRQSLQDFFRTMAGGELSPELVAGFLALSQEEALTTALRYKAEMINRGLSEHTINIRLAALRSLVNFARKMGRCGFDLSAVRGEKARNYRDTSGITAEQVARMLAVPDRSTARGCRDYAILLLLWENALRRGEVVQTSVEDLDPDKRTLAILGKGRGTQKEQVFLSSRLTQSLRDWLAFRETLTPEAPLFISLNNRLRGRALSGDGVAYMVQQTAKAAGIVKPMSPHRLRHSSITAALEATGGNVSLVQKLSRHRKVETVMIYQDAREKEQAQVSELLSKMV